jgi:HK97 gp10 family phage protein
MAEIIEGLNDLLKTFEDLKEIDISDALLAAGYFIQGKAQEKAPVKTGFLRNSAETEKTEDGVEIRFLSNYSWYIENGSARMPARPFLRPAIDENNEEILKIIAEVIEQKLKEVADG